MKMPNQTQRKSKSGLISICFAQAAATQALGGPDQGLRLNATTF
jgi:hypothetical protein